VDHGLDERSSYQPGRTKTANFEEFVSNFSDRFTTCSILVMAEIKLQTLRVKHERITPSWLYPFVFIKIILQLGQENIFGQLLIANFLEPL
jgi:hypothetical protein